jgi:hypothetical protein
MVTVKYDDHGNVSQVRSPNGSKTAVEVAQRLNDLFELLKPQISCGGLMAVQSQE